MAKEEFGPQDIKDIKEYRDLLKSTQSQWQSINKELEKHKYVTSKTKEDLKAQLKSLMNEYGTYKDIVASLKEYENLVKRIEKQQQKATKDLEKSADAVEKIVDSFGELDGLQHSISAQFGKNHMQTKAMEAVVEKTKAQYNGIKSILNNTTDIQDHQRDAIENALELYKNFPVTVSNLNKELKRGKIEQEAVNNAIMDGVNEYSDFISQLDTSNESIALIKARLEDLLPTMDKFKIAAEASKKEFENIDALAAGLNFGIGGVAGGSGIVSNAAEIRKNMLSGTDLKQMTLVGLAVGYVELQAQLQGASLAAARADNAIETAFLDAQLQIVETSLALENFLPDKKALIEYKYELRGLTEEFRAASATAFYGAGIGGFTDKEMAQLQLAGISVGQIADAMNELAMSGNTIPSLATEVSKFAAKTGISSGEISSLIGLFRTLDKTAGANAFLDVQQEIGKMFTEGYNPADIANQLKDSGEVALQYNIRSTKELLKQIKAARDMGTSFDKIAEAGKNMVLNYKDSIRAEMELSAILGENVDLSVARSLFMTNPTEAAKYLKESGLYEKAAQFGIIGTTALDKAIGGFGMTPLNAPALEKQAGLKMPSNQEFLDKLTEAQKNLRIQNARITIENQQEMAAKYTPFETQILRGDKTAIDIAGQLIRQDAQNFLKEQYAKVGAVGDLYADQYNYIRDKIPFGKDLLPEAGRFSEWFGKKAGMYSPTLGINYSKNPLYNKEDVNKYEYLPGMSGISSTEAGIRNLNPTGPKYSFETANKIQEAQKNQEKIATNSDSQAKSMVGAMSSLKSIDAQSILQTQLLQNIQALTAATSNLANIGMGDMRLLLDGKEVKSRIEKLTIQEKGKTRT